MRNFLLAVLGSAVTACSMSDIVGDATSPDAATNSPDAVKSLTGALRFYNGVITLHSLSVAGVASASGFMTDELRMQPSTTQVNYLDVRLLPETEQTSGYDHENGIFARLQAVRSNARQARAILAEYAPASPSALRGHLYALEAMADVHLAELYCSGIPLSTVNPDGSITYGAATSGADVFRAAIALFDSAIALSGDSARVLDFARVGKGRALLGVSQYADAAITVAEVPSAYAYQAEFLRTIAAGYFNGFERVSAEDVYSDYSIGSREGGNGLAYGTVIGTAKDPRTPMIQIGDTEGDAVFAAAKYDDTGNSPIIVASGLEARLIEAEAALRANNVQTWAAILNTLRTDGTSFVTGTDTVWGTGLGFVHGQTSGVRPLSADSTITASPTLREDVMFRERAFWLLLTGHRQGDLRRLLRDYQGNTVRTERTTYPTGAYPSNGLSPTTYGSDITIPVPIVERQRNPAYHGCINRGA